MLAIFKLDQLASWAFGPDWGDRKTKGPSWFWGTCKCGVPMRQVYECCFSAVTTKLDQPASWGPIGWVTGPGIGAGVSGGQRGL